MSNFFPNPFNKDSNLTTFAVKTEYTVETFKLANVFKNLLFLIILGYLIQKYFGIPLLIVGFIFGLEIVLQLSFGVVKYVKIKTLSQLANASIKRFILVREYYDLMQAGIGLAAHFITATLILFFYSNLIKSFNFIFSINWFIYLFVFYNLINLCLKYIRYRLFQNLDENKNLAEINQQAAIIQKKLEMINFFPWFFIFLLAFILFSIHLGAWSMAVAVLSIFGGFALIILVLSIKEIKRISAVDLSATGIATSNQPKPELKSYNDESVLGTIFGIMNLKTQTWSVLGVGKTTKSENSLIITSKRLLMVEVPVTGGSNVVDGVAYSPTNFFFNRKEIEKKGMELLNSGLPQFLSSVPVAYEIAYDNIKEIILNKLNFKITTFDGQKYSYMVMDKENIEKIKLLVGNFVNNIIVK